MPDLPIKGLQSSDAGRLFVRLNYDYRDGINRYGIAKLTNNKNGRSLLTLVLGHDDKRAIYIPFDIRHKLGVEKGGNLDFSIEKTGWLSKLLWYVSSPDPAVHMPAKIALIGIAVGLIGIFVALF